MRMHGDADVSNSHVASNARVAYQTDMHTVIETPMYLRHVRENGLDDAEEEDIVSLVAADPTAGDLMVGTGGARKLRVAGRGKGKSGGYRVIHYFAAKDVPVFLLALFGKGRPTNLTQAQRNDLAAMLPQISEAYRKSIQKHEEPTK